jgi:hypothetical protein
MGEQWIGGNALGFIVGRQDLLIPKKKGEYLNRLMFLNP